MEFMKDMPVRKLPGVGKVNERLLDSIGVKVTFKYLAAFNCSKLT